MANKNSKTVEKKLEEFFPSLSSWRLPCNATQLHEDTVIELEDGSTLEGLKGEYLVIFPDQEPEIFNQEYFERFFVINR